MSGGGDGQKALLAKAVEALRRGDGDAFSTLLAESHALDGLVSAMQRKWPGMDYDLINEAVSTAVEALYVKILDGGVVTSPGAFMWKAAFNTLANVEDRRSREQPLDEALADDRADYPDSGSDVEAARGEAVRLARSLLPSLGQSEGLRNVMSFILDCVEAGEFHVDNDQIASAVGLSPESVRKLKHRGFARLKARADALSIRIADLELSAPDAAETNDEEKGE